jgi:hypothetical protein
MPDSNGSNGTEERLLEKVSEIHEVRRTINEDVFVPGHDPRTASAGYRAMHDHLVKELDRPCIACGVRNSTLDDQDQNPFGATQMETHHKTVEWSLINAIDLDKFNQRIVLRFRHYSPHDPKYDQDFTQEQMEDWIDHDEDNIWVLCDVHHRHKWVGIHSVTGPIWGPQDLIKPGYRYTPFGSDEPG